MTNNRNAYTNEHPCASVRLLLCDGFPLKGSSVSNASAMRPMTEGISTEGISTPTMLGMRIIIHHVLGQNHKTGVQVNRGFRACVFFGATACSMRSFTCAQGSKVAARPFLIRTIFNLKQSCHVCHAQPEQFQKNHVQYFPRTFMTSYDS